MSNIRHYIEALRHGESFFSLEIKLRFIIYLAAAIHLGIAVIFACIPVIPFALLNFFSALLFTIVLQNLVKKGNISLGILIAMTEIMVVSFFETICFGFSSGFMLYNFSMISSIFYFCYALDKVRNKEVVSLILSFICMLCFLTSYLILTVVDPFYSVATIFMRILHIYNSIATFIVLILFSFLSIWEIKASQEMLASQNEKLHEMAHKDPLTHLLNRRSMNIHLQQCMERQKRTGQRFSLILGDIDDFKKINDTYGHDAGDFVLVTIAERITQSLRDGDVVCRWGGEEILILINDPLDIAANAAERIRKKIADSPVSYKGMEIHVTMTFGVCESIPGYRLEDLIQQADEHLYTGKKSGKNIVVF